LQNKFIYKIPLIIIYKFIQGGLYKMIDLLDGKMVYTNMFSTKTDIT